MSSNASRIVVIEILVFALAGLAGLLAVALAFPGDALAQILGVAGMEIVAVVVLPLWRRRRSRAP